MNRFNKAQKDKISQFRTVTGTSEKVATDFLKLANWACDAAVDMFYSSGAQGTSSSQVDTRTLDALYTKYKDSDGDLIAWDGIVAFCEELGVEPTDIVVLVIACYMNAAAMGEFTKEEFISGLQKLNVDSIDKLKKKLPELRAELKREDRFREIYNFAYLFCREKGQKCVPQDTAIGMWQLLFAEDRRWPLIDDWCEFLQQKHNKAISKDTWSQLYDFAKTVKTDFSNFDESSAWPYLMDEFVEFMEEKKK